jgi:hypothetical protein
MRQAGGLKQVNAQYKRYREAQAAKAEKATPSAVSCGFLELGRRLVRRAQVRGQNARCASRDRYFVQLEPRCIPGPPAKSGRRKLARDRWRARASGRLPFVSELAAGAPFVCDEFGGQRPVLYPPGPAELYPPGCADQIAELLALWNC